MGSPLLSWFEYRVGNFSLEIGWDISPGEVLVLYGPSGSGKTMTLRTIAGLIRPRRGHITIDDTVVFDSPTHVWVGPHRRNVGYVPQKYALFPHMTVVQNINYGIRNPSSYNSRREVAHFLEILRLEQLSKHYPYQLSGGQQQRVALGRALATHPRVLLLDEPLSSLDPELRAHLRSELQQMLSTWRAATILVTHDPLDAIALGTRVLCLDQGRVVRSGQAYSMFPQSATSRVDGRVGTENIVEAEILEQSVGESTSLCQVGNCQMVLPWFESKLGHLIQVSVPAAEILLATEEPHSLSAENILPGTVRRVLLADPHVQVEVDCGVLLTATVTPRQVANLELYEGTGIWVIIKANSFFLVQNNRE